VQELDLGTPNEPHRGFESNVAAFVLAPRITTTPATPGDPLDATRGSPLVLDIDPPVRWSQQVRLLIGEHTVTRPPRPPPPPGDPPTSASVSVPIPAEFPVGTYLLRVQVDGAESALDVSTDPNNPQYIGPRVKVQ
jgi:hypothetical protein